MKRVLGSLALALFAVGCTGGDGGGAKKGTLSVTVREGGVPKAGAHILLHSKSGSVVEQLVTGSDGTATSDKAHLDGMATVFAELSGGGGEIQTIAGLSDGDEFDVNLDEDSVDLGVPLGEPDVLFAPFAGAYDYVLDLGCTSDATLSTAGVPVAVYAACTDGSGDADLFAVARDANDAPLAYAFVEGFPAATTNSVQLPTWSTAWTDADVEITGIPANGLAILADARVRGRAGAFGLTEEGSIALAAGGTSSVVIPVPQGLGGRSGVKRTHAVIFGEGVGALEGISAIFQEEETLATDVSLAFETNFLPALGPIENASEDEARPEVEWADVDLAGIDAIIVNVEFDGAELWRWGLFAPPGMADGSLRFPELPEDLAALLPAVDPSLTVIAADADFVDGFEELKALDDFDLENPGVSPAKTKATIGGDVFE